VNNSKMFFLKLKCEWAKWMQQCILLPATWCGIDQLWLHILFTSKLWECSYVAADVQCTPVVLDRCVLDRFAGIICVCVETLHDVCRSDSDSSIQIEYDVYCFWCCECVCTYVSCQLAACMTNTTTTGDVDGVQRCCWLTPNIRMPVYVCM